MIKKYGKIGPNSSWTKMHEAQKKDAKHKLDVATQKADAAFKVALPDFKRMHEEMPEFFTNGKCPCPSTWTAADSARLAAKKSRTRRTPCTLTSACSGATRASTMALMQGWLRR